jgi:hypothetical protein
VAEIVKKDPGAVLSPSVAFRSRKVPSVSAHTVGDFGEDKLKEYRSILKNWGIPTTPLNKILPAGPRQGPMSEEFLEKLEDKLNKKFRTGWVLKSRASAQSAGMLPESGLNLKALHEKYKGIKPEQFPPRIRKTYAQLKELEQLDYNKFVKAMYGNPEYRTYWNLREAYLNPKSVIAQPKIKFEQITPLDSFLEKLLRGKRRVGTQEYRIHAAGGRVIGGNAPRFSVTRQVANAVGVPDISLSRAENHVQKFLNQLPPKFKNLSFSFDVGKTPKGGFHIIESNPSAHSGFLYSPHGAGKFDPFKVLAMNQMISSLQGQATVPLAALRAGAAGTAGLGAYGALYPLIPGGSTADGQDEAKTNVQDPAIPHTIY